MHILGIINPYKRKLEKETYFNIVATILFILIAPQQIFPIIIPFDTIQGYSFYGEIKYPSKLTLINNSADSVTIDSIKIELPFQCEEVHSSIFIRFLFDSTEISLLQSDFNQTRSYIIAPHDTVTISNFKLTIGVESMPPFQCSPSGTTIRDSNFITPIMLYGKNSNDTVYTFGRIEFMTPDGVRYVPEKRINSPGRISDKMTDLSGRKLIKGERGVIISINKKRVVVRGR